MQGDVLHSLISPKQKINKKRPSIVIIVKTKSLFIKVLGLVLFMFYSKLSEALLVLTSTVCRLTGLFAVVSEVSVQASLASQTLGNFALEEASLFLRPARMQMFVHSFFQLICFFP